MKRRFVTTIAAMQCMAFLLAGVPVYAGQGESIEAGTKQPELRHWADEWSEEDEEQEEPAFSISGVQASASGNLVIVVDPGHDSTHIGASGNNLSEEVLTLKIAQYLKQELEKYEGVDVYLTRGAGCPYPGTTSVQCNKKRVEFAKGLGADAYISVHLNASTSSAPYGAEVYFPNFNYRSDIGQKGAGLAQWTLTKLIGLGLYNRGFTYRNSEDNSLYPDNSLADYYGVIKNSKLNGFPGIIIEHAFLTNKSDADNFLSTDEKLRNLGVADAQGIVSYYNLHLKEREYTRDDLKLSITPNAETTQYRIKAEGISYCSGVLFAVWSINNGQDDLQWYEGVKGSSGEWNADMVVNQYHEDGAYALHTYIRRSDGTLYKVSDTIFEHHSDADVKQIAVSDIDYENKSFKVSLLGISASAGIGLVYVPIWTSSDQSDIVWYQVTPDTQGNASLTVDMMKHTGLPAKYNIHAYVQDGNNIMKKVGSVEANLKGTAPTLNVVSGESQTIVARAENVPYPKGQVKVLFAIWSQKDGQDDIEWPEAGYVGDGRWERGIAIDSTKPAGLYFIHAYIQNYDGTMEFIGGTTYEVKQDEVGNYLMGDVNDDGKISLEDASKVLRFALAIEKPETKKAVVADMDQDGKITLIDAMQVLRKALGIEE